MKKKALVVITIGMMFVLCGCGITQMFQKNNTKGDGESVASENTQHDITTETEVGTEIVLGTEMSTEMSTETTTEVIEEVVSEQASEISTQADRENNSQQETNTQNKEPESEAAEEETPKQETSKEESSQDVTTGDVSQNVTVPEETPKVESSETENEPAATAPARGAYLVKGQDIANASLTEGDAMYDVSITTIEGETLSISELLQEKDMVMLNFWFINCYWCDYEFEFMSTAYLSYKDDVEIIAVDAWDSLTNIQYYVEQEQLPFKVAGCPYSWVNAFNVSGCPTTVIIDRYGKICDIHVGAITSVEGFTSIFEQYIGDDYQPAY